MNELAGRLVTSTVRTVYLVGGDAVSSLCSKQTVSGPAVAFVLKVSYLEAFSHQFSQPSLEAAVEERWLIFGSILVVLMYLVVLSYLEKWLS